MKFIFKEYYEIIFNIFNKNATNEKYFSYLVIKMHLENLSFNKQNNSVQKSILVFQVKKQQIEPYNQLHDSVQNQKTLFNFCLSTSRF